MWSSPAWREHQGYVTGPDADWAIGQLRQRGVTYSAMLAAYMPGGARIRNDGPGWAPDPAGRLAVILPVVMGVHPVTDDPDGDQEPDVADLVAFDPAQPAAWRLRRDEYGAVLGGDNLRRCGPTALHEPEITLYPDPLAWLKAGSRGAVLLGGPHCRRHILDIPRVICATHALANAVDEILRGGDLAWPEIRVAV